MKTPSPIQDYYCNNRNIKVLRNTILSVFMFFLSCQNQHSDNTENLRFTLNIKENINQTAVDYAFEDVFSEYHYLKLENPSGEFLRYIQNIILYGDNIFIGDRYNVYQYNINGKFIQRVGAPGNGPGEYYQSRIVFTVDTLSQEVIIKDMFKIIFYDLKTGKFKREFGFDKHVETFFPFGEDNLVFLTQEMSLETLSSVNEVYLMHRDGNIIDSIPNFDREKIRNNMVCFPVAYSSGNGFKYVYGYNDTLYQVSNDFIKEAYALFQLHNSINYKDLIITPENTESDDILNLLRVANIMEYKNWLFITINKGFMMGNYQKILYNKESGKISLVNNFVLNDDDFHFWPSWYSGNVMIDYFFPYQVLDNPDIIKGKNEKLKKLLKTMSEEDNMVLVMVK